MPERSRSKNMQVASQIIFGAGAVLAFWLPVYGFLCARKGLSTISDDI
jgi:hypothetical protein